MASPKEILNVKVISPFDLLFAGSVLSVSSKNSAGNFDLLPEHANFITFINNNPIVLKKTDNSTVTFKFPLAIIYITNNDVRIYAQPETVKI